MDGTFSVQLPKGNTSYSVQVNSRANNAHLFASVLNSPDQNGFYSLIASTTATVDTNLGLLTAAANGNLLGGAFNILDQLLNANLFLLNQVGHCAATFSGCKNFDPSAHKVWVYWTKGFNPNDYFGPGGGALSFYLRGYSRLFILGGQNGDTDNSDTDHFDNSVIIHEYGHFLEDNWLKTDSPGGPHDGDELLDPRLAWSEGWGDFIQAAVRNDPHYIDSIGNVDGTTELAFYADTETTSAGSDYPRFAGEGNFRELAVARLLWDSIDSNSDSMFGFSDDIQGQFQEIWAVLSKSTYGYLDPTFAFRNAGLFHLAQQYLHDHPQGADPAAPDWVNIRGLNAQTADTSHYAQYLVPSTSGSCAGSPVLNTTNAALPGNSYYFSISPATSALENGSYAASDLFQNNRFYHLHFDSPGVHTLQLIYQDHVGVPKVADLDLYLYDSDGRFAVIQDLLGMSRIGIPQTGSPERSLQSETISSQLGAGDYLVDVNVYTGLGPGNPADYNLILDEVVLCPGRLVPL